MKRYSNNSVTNVFNFFLSDGAAHPNPVLPGSSWECRRAPRYAARQTGGLSKFTTYKEFIYAIQAFSQIFFTEFHTAVY